MTDALDERAEPLAGITDAIQAAERFLDYARSHRDRAPDWRFDTIQSRDALLVKLNALK